MTHFYEKNIVEIKNEYTVFLCNIITPLLYEGLKAMYNNAVSTSLELQRNNTKNVNIAGPLKIFQMYLKNIPNLTKTQIEKETVRIKNCCRDREFFDDLIRAVIKSNIVLLTFNASHKKSEIVNQKYHERADITDFIHKCYIECARAVYNNPELFWHEYPNIEINRNQRETFEIIKNSIKEAIRRMLPMKLILMDYLKNDYMDDTNYEIKKNISDAEYANMKNMVDADLYKKSDNMTGGELNESMLDNSKQNNDDYDNETGENNDTENETGNNNDDNLTNQLLGINNDKDDNTNKLDNVTDKEDITDKTDDITSEYTMSIQNKLTKIKSELEDDKTSLVANTNNNNVFVRAEDINSAKSKSEKSEFFVNYIK